MITFDPLSKHNRGGIFLTTLNHLTSCSTKQDKIIVFDAPSKHNGGGIFLSLSSVVAVLLTDVHMCCDYDVIAHVIPICRIVAIFF